MLTGANKWKCDQCDELQDAKRMSQLEKSPDILLVHMKRFKFVQDAKTGMYRKEKLDTMVKFDRKLKLHKLFGQELPSPLEKSEEAQSELLKEKYLIQGVIHH